MNVKKRLKDIDINHFNIDKVFDVLEKLTSRKKTKDKKKDKKTKVEPLIYKDGYDEKEILSTVFEDGELQESSIEAKIEFKL